MTPLAFTVIGLFAGLLLAFLAGSIGLMVYIFRQSKLESAANQTRILRALNASTIAMDKMRGEVALALSSMDANRLHEASLTIQHGVKQFQQAVGGLSKLVFAAGAAGDSMGLDAVNNYSPEVEAHYDKAGYAHAQAHQAVDPFSVWRAEQNMKAAAAAGYATQPTAPTLPDMQQADGRPLGDEDDDLADAYLNQYVDRDANGRLADLPGLTDVSEGIL